MNEPVIIHATEAELVTELFWVLHIDPIAREHGIEKPAQLRRVDLTDHVLEHPDDSHLVLIVRTSGEVCR